MMLTGRRLRAVLAGLVATVLAVTLIQAVDPAEEAEAATASQFNAGNIISDRNFFDGRAMTASQVFAFMRSLRNGCASGATCITDYRQNTPTMARSAYCEAIPGRTAESAASIIQRVGAACGISPRVLLVLIEKEQSLLSLTNPSRTRYERATGFACPDTAPCDSSFGGFFYQIYYAARQFKVYQAFPASFNHLPQRTNTVLFNPVPACGSSRVYIANQATAGLYNYTPYQPNRAALDNLYGTGDSCSAYGNRNFWRMWTDWFGNPSGPISSLVARDRTSGAYWLIDGDTRHRFHTPTIAQQYIGRLGAVQDVTSSQLSSYRQGAVIGRTVRTASTAYYVDNGARWRFTSCQQHIDFKTGSCQGGTQISDHIIERLTDRGDLRNLVGWRGNWWYVEDGMRRQVPDTRVLTALDMPHANSWMSPGALDQLRVGPMLLADGFGAVAYNGSSGGVQQTPAGAVRVTTQQLGLPMFQQLPVVSTLSVTRTPTVQTLPNRIAYGDTNWIVTGSGLLRVSEAQWGGASAFTPVPFPMLRGMPTVGESTGTTLVRERHATNGWSIANGLRAEVRPNGPGWGSTRYQVAAGATDGIPQRLAIAPGTLVRQQGQSQVYMASDRLLIPVTDTAIVNSMGLSTRVVDVSAAQFRGLPAAGAALSTWGIRCDATDMVASGGQLHPYASAAVRADFGIAHRQLPWDVCARIDVSSRTIGSVVVQNGGQLWDVEAGVRHPVDSQLTANRLGSSASTQVRVAAGLLGQLRVGPMRQPFFYTGTVLRPWSQYQDYFVVDAGRVRPLASPALADAFAVSGTTGTTRAAVTASPAGDAIPTAFVSHGGIRYAVVDGGLVRFGSAQSPQFGVSFTPISSSLFAKLPARGWMSQFVRDAQGRTWYVADGRRGEVTTQAALRRLGGVGASIVTLDATSLAAIPVGQAYR